MPNVEGAITRWANTDPVAPARNTSAWSIWEPPATIACTNVSTLRPGSAPPTRPASRTVALISASSSSRAANVATNTRPALATRFGSSKITSMRSLPRDTPLTGNASRLGDNGDFEHRHRPSPGRLFRGYADPQPLSHRWIQAKAERRRS